MVWISIANLHNYIQNRIQSKPKKKIPKQILV